MSPYRDLKKLEPVFVIFHDDVEKQLERESWISCVFKIKYICLPKVFRILGKILVFSGLLMNQHMENNSDWESALALVAPLPTPTHGTGTSTNNTTVGAPTPGSQSAATPGSHQQHQMQSSGY